MKKMGYLFIVVGICFILVGFRFGTVNLARQAGKDLRDKKLEESGGFHTKLIYTRGGGAAVGLFNAVAIDSDDCLHMSHEADNMDMLYTTNVSGDWETTKVDNAGALIGKYSSIAVDSSNKAHIAYFEYTEDETLGTDKVPYGNLRYATNRSGSWQVSVVDTGTGLTPRIWIDGNDNAHIVHTKLKVSELTTLLAIKYSTNKSGSWVTVTISSEVVKGVDASIAVDSNGRVHISCRNEEGVGTSPEGGQGGLRYITNVSGSWAWYDVDTSITAGNDTDITVDSDDNIHISYLDKGAGLKYATNASGIWQTSILDSAYNVGWNTSIAVDSRNKVHISYVDPAPLSMVPGNGYLKYATNEDGIWEISIIDKENAGYSTGIVVNSKDNPRIAYYIYEPDVKGELKYAWK